MNPKKFTHHSDSTRDAGLELGELSIEVRGVAEVDSEDGGSKSLPMCLLRLN